MCGDDPYWSGAGAELGVFRIFLVNDRGTRGLSKSGSTDQKSRLVKAWEAFKVEKFDVRTHYRTLSHVGKDGGMKEHLKKNACWTVGEFSWHWT
jgi:hypothetical protein